MTQFDPRFGYRVSEDSDEWVAEEPVAEVPAEVAEAEVVVEAAKPAKGGMSTENAEALLRKGKVS